MSLRSLSAIAVRRDQAGIAIAGGGPAPPPIESAAAVLIHAIPTEVLAPYTALVGIVVSKVTATNDRSVFRWWLFGIGTALVVITLVANFWRNRPPDGRRFPVGEMLVATAAFGAWGLAMPGSPLATAVNGDDMAIATAAISLGGAFFITLVSPSLTKPAPTP